MKVAIVGCAHGELDKIYESIRYLEETESIRIDFVICCGDFQAIRNYDDLACMAVPENYRTLNTFYKYYSNQEPVPYLTLFIGGNHEASNYLSELPYGGWVAPGIYYLGLANVVQIGGLRIGGISGIYKGHDYFKGHFECPPYDEGALRSVYHIRQLEVFRLKQLKPNQLDVFISHDWPRGIYRFGDERALFKVKPYFKDEAMRGELGNPALEELLSTLKPKYWFSAHMHVKFPALITNDNGTETKFLALDKCLPHRQFLQIMDLGEPKDEGLTQSDFQYDPEWLAILKSTNHLFGTSNRNNYMPGPTTGSEIRYNFTPTVEEIEKIQTVFGDDYTVPVNFKWTAKPMSEEEASTKPKGRWQKFYVNPQTSEFCSKLGISNMNELFAKLKPKALEEAYHVYLERQTISEFTAATGESSNFLTPTIENPDEIQLDVEEELSPDNDQTGEITTADPCPFKRLFEDVGSPSDQQKKEEKDESQTNKETNVGSDVMKKFKRRNAAIYANDDANDD